MKIYLGHGALGIFLAKASRKLFHLLSHNSQNSIDDKLQGNQYMKYVEVFDENANDLIANLISAGKPCMISKFGTVELNHLLKYQLSITNWYQIDAIIDFLNQRIETLNEPLTTIHNLCTNAGFFPEDLTLLKQFYEENIVAMREIDVLGSYCYEEKYFKKELSNATRINLDGYYAPFFYDSPWTSQLKGKRVLVVHPFAEDIYTQYQKKSLIWENPEVLPDFDLITYKAVQSMLNIKTDYVNWFEALSKMKHDIENIEFDIAIIGCGAYGMPLAAFCKQLGKQAIHMAGWTQILFGIKGKRWENNDRVSSYFNEHWIRPSSIEVPKNANEVENACYW